MAEFTCCDKLAGIEMREAGYDKWMWVYACKVCGKDYARDTYDRTGEKIEMHEITLRRTVPVHNG